MIAATPTETTTDLSGLIQWPGLSVGAVDRYHRVDGELVEVVQKGDQDGNFFLESDFEIEPEILSSLEGLFEARKGDHFSYCINPSAETRRQKARTAVGAIGMDPFFPSTSGWWTGIRRSSRGPNR